MKNLKFTLDYGRRGLNVEVPADRVVGPLAIRDVPPLRRPRGRGRRGPRDPIGTPALRQIAQGRKDACILICDITRPVPNQTILRPMLKVLREAGIPREHTLILVATGLHRPSTDAEKLEMLGAGDRGGLSRGRPLRHTAGRAHVRRHDHAGDPRLDRQPVRSG